ncbi:MAG: tetratricopeptide repeat protein [Deltaproteobacteria bacterium]|nr:tetratricopeptide repeat protein [Deltaproteobacteria bacterium]
MVKKARELIEIDLDQFKLHLKIKDKTELSLHFDSPSRRFYISVIAFVVSEMKRLGKITSIPLEHHYDLLALLNETVGGSAGSSEKGNLLPRIYKKWKSALSDLEHAPLFNVLGKRKEYEDAIGKTYRFSEEEKDIWANLFEYKGSHDKIRLRFSVDKLGVGLDDVVITYGEGENLTDVVAWKRYVDDLKEQMKDKSEPAVSLESSPPISGPKKWSIVWSTLLNKRSLAALAGLILVLALISFWNIYFRTPKSRDGSATELALNLNQKPSIAVLPFANISGDPKKDYLSDGITENIITALSKTSKVLVIARNSVFTYKGKPVMVQQVSEELGVGYVLEGSVQRSGDRLRITAQLIDAKTGNHIWSDRYDREMKDLFALQDEITMRIIEGLRVKLTEGEQGRIYSRGTDNLEAYLKVLKGLDLVLSFRSKEDNALGRQMYEDAIALDPGYSNAYAVLAWTHSHDVNFGWTKTPKKSLNLMLENAQKAVSLDESNANAYSVLGPCYRMMRMLDKALAAGKKAIALAPNGADTNLLHSYTLMVLGRYEEALAAIDKAIHLNPIPPMWYFLAQGTAYQFIGQHEEAIAAYKKALLLNPNYLIVHAFLAVSYNLTGQEEKAHAEAKEVLRISPKFSVDRFVKGKVMFRKDSYINALRKAGLK